MQWFRMYAETIDNAKLQLVAPDDRWFYVAILCCKASGLLDGSDDEDMRARKLCVKLRLHRAELDELGRRLAAVRLIDGATWQPVGWAERQFANDTSAERTRRYRDKLKRHSDVTVTGQNRTETEQSKSLTKAEAPSKNVTLQGTKGGEARATRLPQDWQPTAAEIRWAEDERPGLDALREAEKFRDYWHAQAGQRATKRDWAATWRNWVRNARGVLPGVAPAAVSVVQQAENAMRAKYANANRTQ